MGNIFLLQIATTPSPLSYTLSFRSVTRRFTTPQLKTEKAWGFSECEMRYKIPKSHVAAHKMLLISLPESFLLRIAVQWHRSCGVWVDRVENMGYNNNAQRQRRIRRWQRYRLGIYLEQSFSRPRTFIPFGTTRLTDQNRQIKDK